MNDAASLLRSLRTGLLVLVAFGALGLGVELVLLEHWEQPAQWPPLILLGLGFIGALAVWLRPGPGIVRGFRIVMTVAVLSGALGAVFHYRANAALEREIAPDRSTVEIASAAIRGGVPTLAPGAMIQLGLLGLLACLGHPAARSRTAARSSTSV